MSTIKPTYLYVKMHTKTGMKYFGKTTSNPITYKGSGVLWKQHLKENNTKYVTTTHIFGPFIIKEDIYNFAISFSKENNIVEDPSWANLMLENGINGGINKHSGVNFQKFNTKPRSKEWCDKNQKLRMGNKNRATPCIVDGLYFNSILEASKHFRVTDACLHYWKKKGRLQVITGELIHSQL